MFSSAISAFKAMPTWQKGLTVVGVLTVGCTITYVSTKGITAIVNKLKDRKNDNTKAELKEKIKELKEVVKDTAIEQKAIDKVEAADEIKKAISKGATIN